jgi:type II secretory pathway pseudopilin PulG
MRRYRYAGFTVIEILVVVGIICFLLAVISPSLHTHHNATQVKASRILICNISLAAERYRSDFRTLPPDTSVDVGSIWRYLGPSIIDSSGKTHTYDFKIPSEQLVEYNDPIHGKSFKVVDAWMQPITFVGDPKQIRHNRDGCDIFSAGPDKIFGTADDINNWQQ